ncbi:MAG: phosphoribosylamine--glycine ligase, partial [Ilumatobacteraceae bacterium]
MISGHPLTILVVGSGAREHALAHSIKQSPRCKRLLVTPGNGGTPGQRFNFAVDDVAEIVALSVREKVDLVVVGPEIALAAGIADALAAAKVPCFGPTLDIAQLELSKAFTRQLATRLDIPGPRFATFSKGDSMAALSWWHELGAGVVVKLSGLAAGKGVVVPESPEETAAAIADLLAIGDIVLEERLIGKECSLIAFADGQTSVSLPLAQDHKRIGEGDTGLNTGGMGAYAPVSVGISTEELNAQFIQPVVSHFAALGTPYVGMLYAGLMITADGPRLLEFNCRFGDPEAQVLLPLLASDLL